MSKIIRQIAIRGTTVTVFYTWDKAGSGGNNPSRQLKTFTKILDLEKLQEHGALDLDKMQEVI